MAIATQSYSKLKYLLLSSTFLALIVILLGAYTRITDAGLGCPDWPGCYGQLIAPDTHEAIAKANAAYPQAPVEIGKARTEMTHRYFAETLGSLIIFFGFFAYLKRRAFSLPSWLGPLLIGLVLAQGLLGMWTVTLRLFPLVVLAHLLGGFCTLSLLWLAYLLLTMKTLPPMALPDKLRQLSFITLWVLILQIALGGWTSANYAALICPDFPTCQGQWWPELNFTQAFQLMSGFGTENPLNAMASQGRTAIHMSHRLGALCLFLFGIFTAFSLWHQTKQMPSSLTQRLLYRLSLGIGFLLVLQISLGISNVLFFLPLPIAVAHNGVAALLLLCLITLCFVLVKARRTYD